MKQTVPKAFTQCAGVATLILFVWAAIGPVQDFGAGPPRLKDRPVITVGIYNYARVGRLELRDAENQDTALFAVAGVQIAWTHNVSTRRPDWSHLGTPSADVFLRILPASMAKRFDYKPGALGESVIPSGTEGPLKGGIANIFYDRVLNASSDWGLCSGEILGDAIAHELGHLLLGPGHTRKGIMKADWTPEDGELASRSELRFSPEQVAALQRAAQSLQNNPSLPATAKR